MKHHFNTKAILAGLLGLSLGSIASFAAVTVTTTNGITMQTAFMDAETPSGGTNYTYYNQKVMQWLNAALHPHTKGYARTTPWDVVPGQDMWRIWDILYSTSSSFHLWNASWNPTNQYSGEYGTVLQAPLMIGSANQTINPLDIHYSWSSSDFYDAFGAIQGQLAILSGTTSTQSWSTTCVGVVIANGTTNIYTSGLMTNRVNWIYYSGVYGGFSVTDSNSTLYASNYCTGYWPFNISATYTLTDDSGSNIICQSTASLDSKIHWHLGSLTNTAFCIPVLLTLESWDYMTYPMSVYTNQFSGSVPYTIGDGSLIMNTNPYQFFKLPDQNGTLEAMPLALKARMISRAPTPPAVVFGQ